MAPNTTSASKPIYRTVLELALISTVIYVVLGAPGFPTSLLPRASSPPPSSPHTRIEQLVSPSKSLICPPHNYNIHIYSTAPLVLYVDNFLSPSEISHLISQSASKWHRSTIFNAGEEISDDSVRKSDKALLDRDEVVQCIEHRALALQGWPSHTYIERLWTQRYNVSGHYALHYDWATGSKEARRVSSFMVYLEDECTGGGTRFPRLERKGKGEGEWCEFVECDGEEGVTFKVRKGSAVFWTNFDAEGKGYKETIHAGLPVTEGTKVGLNIWTWYQSGYVEPEGEL